MNHLFLRSMNHKNILFFDISNKCIYFGYLKKRKYKNEQSFYHGDCCPYVYYDGYKLINTNGCLQYIPNNSEIYGQQQLNLFKCKEQIQEVKIN